MKPLVVCIKVGDTYGPEYVNRLATMVARQTTVPYSFVCLTDNADGVTVPTEPIGTDLPGWWAKLMLFKPHQALVGRRIIFLDLDTLIVGNMDFLLQDTGAFTILRDFYRPLGYGSAVMAFDAGIYPQIWGNFLKPMMHTYHGDQNWIEANIYEPAIWQDQYPGKIVSYKVHCMAGVPADASVVCFHGFPKQTDFPEEHWVRKVWEHDDRLALARSA